MSAGDLVGVLGGLAGILAAIGMVVRAFVGRGRQDASAAQMMVNTATKLASDLDERLSKALERITLLENDVVTITHQRDDLLVQVKERDQKILKLEAKVEMLTTQITALGQKPFGAS